MTALAKKLGLFALAFWIGCAWGGISIAMMP